MDSDKVMYIFLAFNSWLLFLFIIWGARRTASCSVGMLSKGRIIRDEPAFDSGSL